MINQININTNHQKKQYQPNEESGRIISNISARGIETGQEQIRIKIILSFKLRVLFFIIAFLVLGSSFGL